MIFAAPLGGEYAFAIDGPILPTPSWKLVFQVNDPAHLQQTLRARRRGSQQGGREGRQERSGLGSRGQSVAARSTRCKSQDFGVEVNYVFVNGYMIAGPTRALIEQALRYHDSGIDAEEFGEVHRGFAGRRQRELLGACLSQPGAVGAAV